jgi:hypothetical protein
MRIIMLLLMGCMITACTAPKQTSMTLAEARQQYAHLYQDMEKAYNHPAFNWYDKKKIAVNTN